MIGHPDRRGHDILDIFDRKKYSFIASFVRHPLSWHYSYWQYRNSNTSSWEPEREELDRLCMADSFEKYMSNVIRYKPTAVSDLFEQFTGAPENPISFIGKQENLVDDFITLLVQLDEVESVSRILELGQEKINQGELHPQSIIKYAKRLYDIDKVAYLRFGYEENVK